MNRNSALRFEQDDVAGRVDIFCGDHLVVGWRYGSHLGLPHWFPLRSPSGRDLLTESPQPYPHHQSLWIADKVQLGDGPIVDFYHYPKNQVDPADPSRGYSRAIRQLEAPRCTVDGKHLTLLAKLGWLVDASTVMLEDERRMVVTALEDGEFLLDLQWSLRAQQGPVTFHSDWVHHGWPYLRLAPAFSIEGGGVLIDDVGRRGQAATNGHYANWVDASSALHGVTEGVALFLPQDGEWHRWVTRDYGTFGPRRGDALSGTKPVLARGQSLDGRVRLLVHRGDAHSGRVAERYRDFVREDQR